MQTSSAASTSLSASPRGAVAHVLPRRIVRIVAATLVVAIAAHISFPLWFTPVPLTLQPLAVLAVGLFLGPLDGCLAMFAYLAEGASGLPVFSPGGLGGVAQLVGPTGGYLLSYPLVALICGQFAMLKSRFDAFWAALAGCLVATVALFVCGAAWLAHVTHLSAGAVWIAAVLPFLPGEAVKAVVAAGLFRSFNPQQRAR